MSYIRNVTIGGDTPYVYVTRRTYERPTDTVTLTCMGGPEYPIDGQWRREPPVPGPMLATMDDRSVRSPSRRARRAGHTTSSGTA